MRQETGAPRPARDGPRLRRGSGERWKKTDRMFFRVFKCIGGIAGLGVALRLLVTGNELEALLMVGAVLYVLGIGPFRYLLGGRPPHSGDDR